MKRRLLPLLAILLSACGGGGGSGGSSGSNGGGTTLFVAASYSAQTIYLYNSGSLSPTYSGFAGHTPQCSSPSGLPPGMTLNTKNCIVSGTPTAPGSYYFSVHITAEGAMGSVDATGVIDVPSPLIVYSGRGMSYDSVSLGTQVNDVPYVANWSASSSSGATWSYAITSGSLPTGTTFDTSTGAISGVVTTEGQYQLTVTGTLTSPAGTFTTSSFYSVNVNRDTFGYVNDDLNVQGGQYLRSFISVPYSASPVIFSNGTLSGFSLGSVPLPTGLTLDATTGAISGTPIAINAGQTYPVAATFTTNGVTYSIDGSFIFETVEPLRVTYSLSDTGTVNVPLDIAPIITQVSPSPLPGATYYFQASTTAIPVTGNTPCDLPPGVTFDSQTGHFSGTPTQAGAYGCYLDVTITNNGISWTETPEFYIVISS